MDVQELIIESISDFCLVIKEINFNKLPPFSIKVVEDIYATVREDDELYAERIVKNKPPFGLYYINSKNECELLIKRTDDAINLAASLFHEVVHIHDFFGLNELIGTANYRDLEDNVCFLLWSEFHASYLSNLYFLKKGKECINAKEIYFQLLDKLNNYMNRSGQLDLQEATDFFVRLFGEYIALQNVFSSEMDKYPQGFFINQNFLDLYDFLFKHRLLESVKYNTAEVEATFKNLEK